MKKPFGLAGVGSLRTVLKLPDARGTQECRGPMLRSEASAHSPLPYELSSLCELQRVLPLDLRKWGIMIYGLRHTLAPTSRVPMKLILVYDKRTS